MKFLTLLFTMAFTLSVYANDCTIEITNGYSDRATNPENTQYAAKLQPILEKALRSKGFKIVNEDAQPAHTLVVVDYATCSHRGADCVGLYSQLVLVSNTDFKCDGLCTFEGFSDKIPLTPRASFVKAVNKIPYCR